MKRQHLLAASLLGFGLMMQGGVKAQTIRLQPVAPAQAPMAAPKPAQAVQGKPAAPERVPLGLDSRLIPIGGKLAEPAAWSAYKQRFLTEQGRIIDTANHGISHSEGQGYGMLLAVAANDRASFERIWGWTRANLKIRDDGLLAWRFDGDKRPGITDVNNATDGDILVAWALAEAGEFWSFMPYSVASHRLVSAIASHVMLPKTAFGSLLLPGASGFDAKEQGGAPVVNLSYFIFPAFTRFKQMAPDIDWETLTTSGLKLLRNARFSPAKLPSEWIKVDGKKLAPANGFPAVFGYNAIRIPLYMALAGIGEREDYTPFAKIWSTDATPMTVINLDTGRPQSMMGEPGYTAIAALTRCITSNQPFPPLARFFSPNQNYYPATLQLLSILAAKARYPTCVPK